MRRIILYFGSFNPVHEGHTAVAGWVADRGIGDEVWLVVSPRNPLKDDAGLAPDTDRLEMARLAVGERLAGRAVTVSDVEFGLPRPSYTIDTLRFLEREYPGYEFSILAGTDILEQLRRWKESAALTAAHRFYIYPRDGFAAVPTDADVRFLDDAPRWEYSSTDVRRTLVEGGDASAMVAPVVARYIEEHGLWQPATAEAWLRRGKMYNANGAMDKALNAFLRAIELDPSNAGEAAEYVRMLREIFAFRYLDYYNP